jgi:hypothetical protein
MAGRSTIGLDSYAQNKAIWCRYPPFNKRLQQLTASTQMSADRRPDWLSRAKNAVHTRLDD